MGGWGTKLIYSVGLTYAPDGSVITANDSVNGNWSYGYEGFNRLLSSNKNSGALSFTYDYDRYGNRWHQNVTAGSGPAPQYAFSVNSRPTGSKPAALSN